MSQPRTCGNVLIISRITSPQLGARWNSPPIAWRSIFQYPCLGFILLSSIISPVKFEYKRPGHSVRYLLTFGLNPTRPEPEPESGLQSCRDSVPIRIASDSTEPLWPDLPALITTCPLFPQSYRLVLLFSVCNVAN